MNDYTFISCIAVLKLPPDLFGKSNSDGKVDVDGIRAGCGAVRIGLLLVELPCVGFCFGPWLAFPSTFPLRA